MEATTLNKSHKWMSLLAMVIVLFMMQFSCLITAGVATIIMPELGLTPAQFGMLCNMPFLAGVLFGILMGNIGDKIGIKKVMIIGIIVFVVGAFWRAYSYDFVMLMISSLCMGFGVAVLNSNSTKGIRLWFPGPAMAPAMGLYVTGASIGAGIAISAGPYFATYNQAFLVCGFLAIASLIVWILMYRTHPSEKAVAAEGADTVGLAAFKDVMKNKHVWIVSFMIFFIFGTSTTVQTYMSAGFIEHSGGQVASVSTLSLASSVAVAVGSIFAPMVITKFKLFRPVMIVFFIITAASTALSMLVPYGALTFVMIIVYGVFMGGVLAMGKAVPALLPNIDPRNLGAVGGFHSTLQNIGAWCIAGYIIAPICQGAFAVNLYPAIYVGAAVSMLLAGVCTLLLPKDLPTAVGGPE